jgi:hypothetical protein
MKIKRGAWLLALTTMGVAGAGMAHAETYRCQQADGAVTFQAAPCSLPELVAPAPPPSEPVKVQAIPPVKPAAPVASAPPVAALAPPRPVAAERSVSTPAPVAIPPQVAGGSDDDFVRPTKRKRDILELSAQFERCRADVPGFAEQSATLYAAWKQRHAAVLAEYRKLLAAKVRAGRRGELTLPLSLCTDEWLRQIEPLSRLPDPRFQTVEKTWEAFLGALMTGDRATLLNCLSGPAEARWKEHADRLSDEDMRRVAASVRGLKVQWGDDYEKEGLVTDNDNHLAAIAFRNVNEEWKITELGAASTVSLPATPPAVPAAPAAAATPASAPVAALPAAPASAPVRVE